MNIAVKISLGVAGVIVIALAAVFLLSNGEEKAIEELLETGRKAAEEGNAEGAIALISPDYRNGDQTYDGIVKRIRQAVSQRITPVKMEGAAIQVSGDAAEAGVRVIVGAFQFRQEFGLRLKLKKESGVWKVTGTEEVGR
jgi:hypothetical protein